jgi:hypothetical protein
MSSIPEPTRARRAVFMNALPMVHWDRASGDVVYGWIQRDDGKLDFVALTFEDDGSMGWTTSSAKWSDEISRILGGDDGEHFPCESIDDLYGDLVGQTGIPPSTAAPFADERVIAVVKAIMPLFRHGGFGGASGFGLGWNAEAQGYGLIDHESGEWFPDQTFMERAQDVDSVGFFTWRILRALASVESGDPK